jgi:2-polyprenyl-3-methyl-5-hydroxy-6-metoxy-1,4-benzoquinol methylase
MPAPSRSAFDAFVRWTIVDELPAAERILPAEECASFRRYYGSLPAPGDTARIAAYTRGFWRSEAGWTCRWIMDRRARGLDCRVMDAGSGFGTYAMLYAVCGAEVVGADLRPDRLDAAQRRLDYYGRSTGVSLPVRYERADLTREWAQDVDLVWVYNALSHIDPLEGFLEQTRAHLRPGGVLVVGDINGGHPAHRARLAELRTEVHQEYVAPDGSRHAYAVEREFPPSELRALLVDAGFRVVHHELYWGGLSALPDAIYENALRPLQRAWRLGERLGRRQLMVAAPVRREA